MPLAHATCTPPPGQGPLQVSSTSSRIFFGSIPYLSTDCLFFYFQPPSFCFPPQDKKYGDQSYFNSHFFPTVQYQQASKAQKNKVHNQNSVTYISIASYLPPHRQNTARLKHRSINLNNNSTRLVHLARPTAPNFIEIYSR